MWLACQGPTFHKYPQPYRMFMQRRPNLSLSPSWQNSCLCKGPCCIPDLSRSSQSLPVCLRSSFQISQSGADCEGEPQPMRNRQALQRDALRLVCFVWCPLYKKKLPRHCLLGFLMWCWQYSFLITGNPQRSGRGRSSLGFSVYCQRRWLTGQVRKKSAQQRLWGWC